MLFRRVDRRILSFKICEIFCLAGGNRGKQFSHLPMELLQRSKQRSFRGETTIDGN